MNSYCFVIHLIFLWSYCLSPINPYGTILQELSIAFSSAIMWSSLYFFYHNILGRIQQKQWQWSHSEVPPLSILFHELLGYWYIDHCNISWFEVTQSLLPVLQLTAACWLLISSGRWTYTSGLLGMKGTLFLKVHAATFFIQHLEPQLAPIYLFRFFFSALAEFVPPPLKG